MSVPGGRIRWLGGVLAAVCAVGCAGAWAGAPKQPGPVVRLPLDVLGMPAYSKTFLDTGSSMLSVHFVDATHLLVTYSMRGLVERVPNDDPDDDDRAVAGVLVELPGGRVIARTRWHMHDHGQYIWALGKGRFLLRKASRLTSFTPMANLASGNAFRETPFLDFKQSVDVVSPSVDGEIVTVETSPRKRYRPNAAGTAATVITDEPEGPPRKVEGYRFVRVVGDGSAASPVVAVNAGSVRVNTTFVLPLSGRGYLFAKNETKTRWRLGFENFDGEQRKLATLESSCAPHLQFVAPAQFVALSCRGSDDKLMISSFDFVPRETWEDNLAGVNAFAHFAAAPAAGRFAVGRVISMGSLPMGGATGLMRNVQAAQQDALTSQEIRVYQAVSGDLLLRLVADPVQRTGQNFDLADDGRSLLVVRGGAIEIYALPELSAVDRKDLDEVTKFNPAAVKTGEVVLRQLLRTAATATVAEEESKPEAAEPAVAAKTAAPVVASPAAEAAKPANATEGDAAPRKAPSLLAPGESIPK